MTRIRGTVRWFNDSKGYGFIFANSADHFVHYTEIKAEGHKTLNEGEEVEFESEKTPKGFQARDVVRITMVTT